MRVETGSPSTSPSPSPSGRGDEELLKFFSYYFLLNGIFVVVVVVVEDPFDGSLSDAFGGRLKSAPVSSVNAAERLQACHLATAEICQFAFIITNHDL